MEFLKIGVGWSTSFERPWFQRIAYRKLSFAYRAPSFVVAGAVGPRCELDFLRLDESLVPEEFDGKVMQRAEDVDLLYLATHGVYHKSTYSVAFHIGSWTPCDGGLGQVRPSVAVFDTCDLVDLDDPAWQISWLPVGPALRLLLGFASAATVAEGSTRRGEAFATRIATGEPIAQAWLQAVHATAYPDHDLGVAIAFGDDQSDAEWALDHLSLADLPAPRAGGIPTIVAEVCH